MAKIFLSYSREDKEKVEKLYHDLQDAGFKPWMDTQDILPGERWKDSIERAQKQADFFVVCLSKESANKRGFLQREIKKALDLGIEKLDSDIYLIPVRLEECEVPENLSDYQWLDFFKEHSWKQLVRSIVTGMARKSESPSRTGGAPADEKPRPEAAAGNEPDRPPPENSPGTEEDRPQGQRKKTVFRRVDPK